jgi:hypothetical protein
MRYLVLLKAARTDAPPPPELMDAIAKLGQEAAASGALVDTAGLAPSTAAARVHLSGGAVAVTDGPFAEAKEMISYALYQVGSKEEAIDWTSRFMELHRDLWPGWEGEAEVVRAFGPEDFAPQA